MLPGADGWDVCRFLARSPDLKQIPIIIFTAKSAREDFDLARQFNLAGFFTKPYATADVLRHVEKVLSKAARS
jgi:CheY-like chemotaxis protein